MNVPKIGVIISTTRGVRLGEKAARWLLEIANRRTDMHFELIDLRDFPMPFFDEVASNAWAPTQNEVAQRWQKKVAEFDGYIFVTAEYNNSVPAVLKNALDYAYPEWNRKAAAFMGYGTAGGARSIQHLRDICVELQMAPVRHAVLLQGGDFMSVMQGQKGFGDFEYLTPLAEEMLNQLSWWVGALKAARG